MPPAKNPRRSPTARKAPARPTRPGLPSRPTRPSTTSRPTGRVNIRRRKPEPKGAEKVLGMLTGTAGKAGKVAPSSAKGKSGLALLGAGAAAAFSQRDKLAGLLGKGKKDELGTAPPVESPTYTPPAV